VALFFAGGERSTSKLIANIFFIE
jgi:hypothetical protein